MKRLLFILITLTFCSINLHGQSRIISRGNNNSDNPEGDSKRNFSSPKEKIKRAPIEWYKIISHERDTTYLDTTQSIYKEYKFNYLRKDNFELVAFVNVGASYIELAKQESNFRAFPKFGSRARHFGFFEKEDINYYNVPTPLTDLYYKTVLEQGQQLDAFLTVNTSPNLNFSIAYKGVRSLGDYRNELTSTKAFRGTLSYQLPNKRYVANLHFVDQSFENEENGGLSTQSEIDFTSGDTDFDRRSVLSNNLSNAENLLEGKRFYIDHEYRIIKKDTLQKNQLSIAHTFNSSVKEFTFEQTNSTIDIFGASQRTGAFRDKNELNYLENSIGLRYENPYVGSVDFMVKNSFFNYSYNSIIEIDSQVIPNQITDNVFGITGNYRNSYKGFDLKANIESTFTGDYKNQFFYGTAGYNFRDEIAVNVGYKITSEAPEINKLINQSNYIQYNWFNDFSNTVTNSLIANIKSRRFFDAELTVSNINNYTYFSSDQSNSSNVTTGEESLFQTRAFQANESLQLLKLKLFRTFKYRKFSLVNTVLFQQVEGNTDNLVYNVPSLVTRNTLYYQNEFFNKKALFMQLGATLKFYSKYYVDGFDPLLGESFTQNSQQFGGEPLVDIFLNAKVRQTRIFLKLENAQHIFEQNKDLLTLNTPTRDFLIRFGLVWNFFL